MKLLKKRSLSLALVLILCVSFVPVSFAASNSLLETTNGPQFEDEVKPVLLEEENDRKAQFFGGITENVAGIIAAEEAPDAIAPADKSNEVATAAAPALTSVTITHVWRGNDPNNDNWTDANIWDPLYENAGTGATNLTGTIDATGFDYIRFRVRRMGYADTFIETLDGVAEIRSMHYRYLDQYGNTCPVGGTIYGFEDDFIFSIPHGSASSNAKFRYIQGGVSVIEREANATFTWTTPTGEAPTTPAITYNAHPTYGLVTGIDSAMEYRAAFSDGTYTSWTTAPGTSMYVPIYDEAYDLQIRYKVSDNGNPSRYCELHIKTRSDGPIDYMGYWNVDEILGIFESGRQIEVALGDNGSYFPISPGYYTLETFINAIPTGGFDNVYVRYAATVDEPASYAYYYTLYARNPNTPDDVYYENGMLYNLTSDLMFRFNGGTWYTTTNSSEDVTSFMSTTSTTLLELRYMPTATTSCSAIREIILPAL